MLVCNNFNKKEIVSNKYVMSQDVKSDKYANRK